MARLVRFTAPREAEVVELPDEDPGPGQVRLDTLYSGISTGTELTVYRGTNPYFDARWNSGDRLFVPGPGSMAYPVDAFGYEEVGRVGAVGDGADPALVGRLVWGLWGHRSSVLRDAAWVLPRVMPDDASPVSGVFAKIGAIALNAVLDADIHVGETVAVFGAGVPGQLVAQLARLNGARVVVADLLPVRRELALALGADEVLDPAAGSVAEHVRSLTEGRGADVVIEMSGSHRALHEAVRTAAYSSRVVVSGFFQGGADAVRLGEEFHHNRVSLVGSQISGVAPALQHRWDEMRMSTTVLDLALRGRLRLEELITHTLPAEQAPEAFRMLDRDPDGALQVVLDYGVPA